jgi:parallel beta-helix repeat protein
MRIIAALSALLVSSLANAALPIVLSGALESETIYQNREEIVVTEDVLVPEGGLLVIGPGCRMTLSDGVTINAVNAVVRIVGGESTADRVTVTTSEAETAEIGIEGSDGILEIAHADVAGLKFLAEDGAALTIADSTLENYFGAIVHCKDTEATLLRTTVRSFGETLFQRCLTTVDYCLFEDVRGDGVDFDTAVDGSMISNSTFRDGTLSNADAIDIGSASGPVTIANCSIENFPSDKAISIGEGTVDTVVEDCLIRNCAIGIAVKDSSNALMRNCTILDCEFGLLAYEKVTGGGPGTLHAIDTIVWNTTTPAEARDTSTVTAAYSTLNTDSLFPGDGNGNAPPTFRDRDDNDFRLADDSPLLRAGSERGAIGAGYPTGGLPGFAEGLAWVSPGLNSVSLLFGVELAPESRLTIVPRSELAFIVADAQQDIARVTGLSPNTEYFATARLTNFIGSSPSLDFAFSTDTDADQDGMADTWELENDLDPENAADAMEDDDEDGFTNRDEWRAGSNPQAALEEFALYLDRDFPFSHTARVLGIAWRMIRLSWRDIGESKWMSGDPVHVYMIPPFRLDLPTGNSQGRIYRLETVGEP